MTDISNNTIGYFLNFHNISSAQAQTQIFHQFVFSDSSFMEELMMMRRNKAIRAEKVSNLQKYLSSTDLSGMTIEPVRSVSFDVTFDELMKCGDKTVTSVSVTYIAEMKLYETALANDDGLVYIREIGYTDIRRFDTEDDIVTELKRIRDWSSKE